MENEIKRLDKAIDINAKEYDFDNPDARDRMDLMYNAQKEIAVNKLTNPGIFNFFYNLFFPKVGGSKKRKTKKTKKTRKYKR